MAALMFFGTEFDKGRPPAPEIPAVDPLPDGALGEKEAKAIVAGFGLPAHPDEQVSDAAKGGDHHQNRSVCPFYNGEGLCNGLWIRH